MSRPTELMVAIDRRLKKWRQRDFRCPDYGIPAHYGINRIRQGLADKDEAREALNALLETGRVIRTEFTNGILWQAAPPPYLDGFEHLESARR